MLNTATLQEHFADITDSQDELELIVRHTDARADEPLRRVMQKHLGALHPDGTPVDPLIELPQNGLVLIDNEVEYALLRDGAVLLNAYCDRGGPELFFPIANVVYTAEDERYVLREQRWTLPALPCERYGWVERCRLQGVTDPHNTVEQLMAAGEIG